MKKLQYEEAHLAEFNQFNEFWDLKMIEFNEQAIAIEEQMINKHQQELTKFLEELENFLPIKPKDSAEMLNLKRIQESLARQKEYFKSYFFYLINLKAILKLIKSSKNACKWFIKKI